MKKNILKTIGAAFACVAIAQAFWSCAADDPFMSKDGKTADGSDPYFTVNIIIPTDETRAGTEDDQIETSGTYDSGVALEYAIKNLHLYFFDTTTKKIVTFDDGDQYINVTLGTASTVQKEYEYNDTYTYKGVMYTSTEAHQIPAGTYYVCALCNDANMYNPQTFTDLDDFLDSTHTLKSKSSKTVFSSWDKNGIPMSSRSWDGDVYQEVTISTANTISAPAEIDLYVEREMARIRYMNSSTSFTLYDTTGKSLGTVVLNDKEVLNNPAIWYAFRHVGSIETTQTPYSTPFASGMDRFGTVSETNGRYYVITPATAYQNLTGNYADNDSPLFVNPVQTTYYYTNGYRTFIDWVPWSTAGLSASSTIAYVPENVMAVAAQNRGNATCVMFRAEIRPTQARALIKYINNTPAKMVTLTYSPSYDSLTTGYEYTYTHKAYADMYYYNGTFYANLSGLYYENQTAFPGITTVAETDTSNDGTTLTPDNVQTLNPKVKRYRNHLGYYFFYIRHKNNDDDTVMGRMEFSIVRNNSYDITINKVYFPAYDDNDLEKTDPTIDPSDPLEGTPENDPGTGGDDKDEEINAYIDADVIVRPWISRPQTGNLGEW